MTEPEKKQLTPIQHLRKLQLRQELHDRYFHTDIYVLPKAKRLQHLVLHHAKYIPKIYVGADLGFNLKETALDGIIVCMSMLNVCNREVSYVLSGHFMPMAQGSDDRQGHVDRLIGLLGSMAKVMEDIDHMDAENPLQQLADFAGRAMACYMHLFQPNIDLSDLFNAIAMRLYQVERKSTFYDMHIAKIRTLYPNLEL